MAPSHDSVILPERFPGEHLDVLSSQVRIKNSVAEQISVEANILRLAVSTTFPSARFITCDVPRTSERWWTLLYDFSFVYRLHERFGCQGQQNKERNQGTAKKYRAHSTSIVHTFPFV